MLSKTIKVSIGVLLMITAYGVDAQDKKVAVVTFYVNKSVSMADLDGTLGTAASVAAMAGDPKFDLESILKEFHQKFFTEYAKVLPFEFIPEEKVINSESYQNLRYAWDKQNDRNKSSVRRVYTGIDGYKILLTESFNKKGQMEVLHSIESEADGIMYINLSYAFIKKLAFGGMGAAGVEARIEMLLYNKEGKNVFRIYEKAQSKASVALVKGIPVMEAGKILPLCEDASEQIIDDLNDRLKKINKKVARKL